MSAETPNPARVKGGKIAAAKKLAQKTGQAQLLQEYQTVVNADGTVVDISNPAAPKLVSEAEQLDAELAPTPDKAAEQAAEAAGMEPASPAEMVAGIELAKSDGVLGVPAAPSTAAADPVPAGDPIPESSGPAAEIEKLLALGVDLPTALEMVNKQAPAAPAETKAAIESRMLAHDNAVQGPDPAQLAAYQEYLKTYTPPVLETDILVRLPVRFADYVKRFAAMETVKRRRDVTLEDAAQMIIREHWLTNPLRALLEGTTGGTGPAGVFNPQTGQWG